MLKLFCIVVVCLLSNKGYVASLDEQRNGSSHSAGDVVLVGNCGLFFQEELYEIRFDGDARPPIVVCYNNISYNTIWTKHEVDGLDLAMGPPSNGPGIWNHDGLFPAIKVDECYPIPAQRNALDNLLALVPGVPPIKGGYYYIGEAPTQMFMSKGQLAPKEDYRTLSDRETTFHYINAVPHWQINTLGNWGALENAIRLFAISGGRKIEVYTGTHGETQLDNDLSMPIDIWLGNYVASSPPRYEHMPVPRIMWKCFKHPTENQHFLFIVNNNPHKKLLGLINPLVCVNTCDYMRPEYDNRPDWVVWETMEERIGFTYCCKLQSCDQVQLAIPGFPGLNATMNATFPTPIPGFHENPIPVTLPST